MEGQRGPGSGRTAPEAGRKVLGFWGSLPEVLTWQLSLGKMPLPTKPQSRRPGRAEWCPPPRLPGCP